MSNELTVSQYLNQDFIQESIRQTLGNKAPQFIASVSALSSSNKQLAACDKKTLMSACLTAAALDLPINQNLGFAYIIPYNKKIKSRDEETGRDVWTDGVPEAQFQMGWKGFVQLAQRSGLYKTINVSEVRAGELGAKNRLTGEISFNWIDDEVERGKVPVVGYVAFFELTNSFSKTLYMTKDEMEAHAKRYSKAYTSSKGMNLWKDDFDTMAKKTVLKMLIGKYGPMTVEMQKAVTADQAVISEDEQYPDNPENKPEGEDLSSRMADAQKQSEGMKMGDLKQEGEDAK